MIHTSISYAGWTFLKPMDSPSVKYPLLAPVFLKNTRLQIPLSSKRKLPEELHLVLGSRVLCACCR